MRYIRKKTDGNHAAIGKALNSVTVAIDVHELGRIGCDYIARHVITKAPVLIEVKDPKQPKSKRNRSTNEATMRDLFPGHWRMVLTEDEALRAVGINVPEFAPADLSSLARDIKRGRR